MTTLVRDTLVAARALIAYRERWVQWRLAVDIKGGVVPVFSNDAYAFCADGALCRSARFVPNSGVYNVLYDQVCNALDTSSKLLYKCGYVTLNDRTDIDAHDAVLKVFDLAISSER